MHPIGSVTVKYPERLKAKALLIIPKDFSGYVYKGTGSAVTIPGVPLEKWVFPVGELSSDLIQKNTPLLFEEVETVTTPPSTSGVKKARYELILKPSIEYFNFRPSTNIDSLDLRPSFMIASWVEIRYKLEVLNSDNSIIFRTVVTGIGTSKTSPADFASKASLAKSAEKAVQKGIGLLLNSLYESEELRKSF